jgi:hypothetical protein
VPRPPDIVDLIDPDGPNLDEQIYHLRIGGLTFRRIARELNISLARVSAHYQNYLEVLASCAPHSDTREVEVSLELERLDRIQEGFWKSATEQHTEPMVMKSGSRSYVEDVEVGPNATSARMVLEVMKHRAKLKGWDQPDPQDAAGVQRVLIIGGSQESFLEALQAGRRPALTSGHRDNEEEDVVGVEVSQ